MEAHGKPTTGRPRRLRLAMATVLAVAASGCWPAPGQGPDRAAHNAFETTITTRTVRKLRPIWTATTDSVTSGGVVGPPVVSNATVHVSDGTALHSFDEVTGARLWSNPDPATFSPFIADPIADGDRVLLSAGFSVGFGGSWTGFAQWLDARTGVDLGGGPGLRVTALRGTKVAGYSAQGGDAIGFLDFGLHVVDLADPAAGWSRTVRFSFDDFTVGPPATLGARRLYFAGNATESYEPPVETFGVRAFPLTPPATCAVPPEGGPRLPDLPCPLWATPTAGRPVTSPVLDPGESVVYVGIADGGAGTLLALDAADGHVLWNTALGAVPSADPALAEGWLYVPLANGDLVALRAGGCGADTCNATWRAHLGGAARQPAVAGGVVFAGTDAGRLVALRATGCGHATCHALWRRDLGAAITGAPAVTGGRALRRRGAGPGRGLRPLVTRRRPGPSSVRRQAGWSPDGWGRISASASRQGIREPRRSRTCS